MTEIQCQNIIESTGKRCGEDPGTPFDTRFCSEECADRVNAAELAELGITPDMMREALNGYFECKDMIKKRKAEVGEETEFRSPAESSRPQEGRS